MRFVCVLIADETPEPPPGIAADDYRAAMLEDVYEVAAALDLVTPAIAAPAGFRELAESVTWPGTPVITANTPLDALRDLAALGATAAVLLPQDVPDLPGLIIGKLFRALGNAAAAVSPAPEGLAALAVQLPLPEWLEKALSDLDLNAPDALTALRAAAPFPGQIQKAPGWHRLRTPADIHFLDPGLEGWDNTRTLLSTPRRP